MKKVFAGLCVALVAGFALGAGNFVHDTESVAWVNPGAAVSAGDLVDLGNRYGVVLEDVASNATGTVTIKGVWSFQRADTNAIAAGADVYYSTATSVTATATADKYLGQCTEAVAVCTELTNSLGQVTKYVKVDINLPQRQCVVGTDVQAYDAALAAFVAAPKASTNLDILLGDGTTGTLSIVNGIITNAP